MVEISNVSYNQSLNPNLVNKRGFQTWTSFQQDLEEGKSADRDGNRSSSSNDDDDAALKELRSRESGIVKRMVSSLSSQMTNSSFSSGNSKSIAAAVVNKKPSFRVEETMNGIQIQIKQPHLISVTKNTAENNSSRSDENNVPMKTSIKIYPLKLGRTTVGSSGSNDIVVAGKGIDSEHCFIENSLVSVSANDDDGQGEEEENSSSFRRVNLVTLYPIGRLCALDGVLVESPVFLNSGKYGNL